MNFLATFQIHMVPRFSYEEADARAYDSFVGQHAFWNALIFQLVQKHQITAEIRVTADGFEENLIVAVRLLGEPGDGFDKDLRQIEALLPGDYRWEKTEFSEGNDLKTTRIARICRRLEYIDLPAISSSALTGPLTSPSTKKATLSPDQPRPSAKPGSLPGIIIGALDIEHDMLRELPPSHATLADLHTRRYCLALPGQIDQLKSRQRTLYQEFQRAGRAIVSLCVHPIDEQQLTAARFFALGWKRFLDPFASEIASSGFAEFPALRSAYSRFSLPASYLVNVTIRVAATTDEKAVSLANIVATSLGGTKAFRVFPPTRDSELSALVRRDVDVPSSSWQPGTFTAFRKALLRDLYAQGISLPTDEGLMDFILLLPHVYTIEEAERIMRLPSADEEGLPGLDSCLLPPFTIPSLKFHPVVNPEGSLNTPSDAHVRIGMVRQAGIPQAFHATSDAEQFAPYAWHTIRKEDLTKHALIVGSTGSGKTMTTLFLAQEISRLGVPLMVIEPVKTEYYERLKGRLPNLHRVRLEGSDDNRPAPDFLAFDPLRIQRGITVARHVSYLKSCFEAAFPMETLVALLLENGLLEYYTAPKEKGGCGLNKFSRGGETICRIDENKVYPSFATFRNYFLNTFIPREFPDDAKNTAAMRTKDIQNIFRRRFANLADGLIGECFKKADFLTIKDPVKNYDYFSRFLSVNTIVELDAVPDAEQKALLMAFILTYIYERRQADDLLARERGQRLPSTLRHMMIVEEAHRVLSASAMRGSNRGESVGEDSKAKAVGLFVDMLAEIRAFGQGLAIVEQIPTKIVPEAVKNTNLKIMLRLTSKDDRDYLGEAMSFTEAQKRFVTNLKVEKGEAINFVIFEEGVDQPLMLSLPLPRELKENWLYDEFFTKIE